MCHVTRPSTVEPTFYAILGRKENIAKMRNCLIGVERVKYLNVGSMQRRASGMVDPLGAEGGMHHP